jgi:hypothetical protein
MDGMEIQESIELGLPQAIRIISGEKMEECKHKLQREFPALGGIQRIFVYFQRT